MSESMKPGYMSWDKVRSGGPVTVMRLEVLNVMQNRGAKVPCGSCSACCRSIDVQLTHYSEFMHSPNTSGPIQST